MTNNKRRGSKPDIEIVSTCSRCMTPFIVKVSWHDAIEVNKAIIPENWKVIDNKILCPNCYEQKQRISKT
jgi:hypothetical protein